VTSRRDPGDGLARIARGDRVVVLGRTGSGKSVFLRAMLARYSRAVLSDPKGRAVIDGWPIVYGLRAFRSAWPAAPRVVARPGPAEDRVAWFDGLCRWVYANGETALGVDEIIGLASSTRPSIGFDMVLTQGRELGITTYTCTQRPKRIPSTILSETDHVVVFTLQRLDDREAVAEVIGDYGNPVFGTFRFVYWSGRLTNAIESRPIHDPGARGAPAVPESEAPR
jgi:energy-coupling factor transporter ATP-binding protein EcfA2